MPTLTAFSSTADGRIRSSNATYSTARSGSNLNASTGDAAQYIGQFLSGGTYEIFQLFLDFDTSSIPDDATIDSATLSLVVGFKEIGGSDFTIEARLHPWGGSLTTADYVAGASIGGKTLLASKVASTMNNGVYTALTSDAAFVSNINKTGLTEVILVSSRFTNNNAPTGAERVWMHLADESGTSKDPKLVVEYTEASSATDLVIQDAIHSHAADGPTLSIASALVIQDATHSHTADTLALTQAHSLAVADATHGHTTDAVALTQAHSLVVHDATHAQAADAPTLVVVYALAVQDATHGHTADSLALTQLHILTVADAAHAHTGEDVVLTTQEVLEIQDALHDHEAGNLDLDQIPTLAIADSVHAHQADSLALTQLHILVVQDASHEHTTDGFLIEPDWAYVAEVVRPLRRRPGGVYRAAAHFGVPGDTVFMSWITEAKNRGHDVGDSRPQR